MFPAKGYHTKDLANAGITVLYFSTWRWSSLGSVIVQITPNSLKFVLSNPDSPLPQNGTPFGDRTVRRNKDKTSLNIQVLMKSDRNGVLISDENRQEGEYVTGQPSLGKNGVSMLTSSFWPLGP